MAVVFVLVLPRIVDYGAVVAALSRRSRRLQLAALAGTTGLAYVANATPSRILIPGLSWPPRRRGRLAGRAVVAPSRDRRTSRPFAVRQWAIPADTATAGIVFNAFFETLWISCSR